MDTETQRPIGCVVRIWCEYVLEDGRFAAQPWDMPFSEWNADEADKWVRLKFAELARNMAADHPAEAAAIERALAKASEP